MSSALKLIESGKFWRLRDRDGTDPLECDGSVVWSDASNALFYVTMDDAHRPHRLYHPRIINSFGHWIDADDPNECDELLMEEEDEMFNLRIAKSFDGKYLLVRSSSKESSEVHYIDLRPGMGSQGTSPENSLVCIARRKIKVLYRVTHCEGYWLVQTNIRGLPNLSLKVCRVGEEGMEIWKDVVGNDFDAPVPVFDGGHKRSLDEVTMFNPLGGNTSPSPLLSFAVVTGRKDGMPRVWILEFIEEDTHASKDFS